MHTRIKGILVLILGILSLVVGLAGFAIPFLPGWLLIAVGLILLSLYFPSLRAWLDSYTTRWPKMHAFIHRFRTWADRTIGSLD